MGRAVGVTELSEPAGRRSCPKSAVAPLWSYSRPREEVGSASRTPGRVDLILPLAFRVVFGEKGLRWLPWAASAGEFFPAGWRGAARRRCLCCAAATPAGAAGTPAPARARLVLRSDVMSGFYRFITAQIFKQMVLPLLRAQKKVSSLGIAAKTLRSLMFGDVRPQHKLLTGQWVIDKDMHYSKLWDCLNYLLITYEVRDETTRANWQDVSLISAVINPCPRCSAAGTEATGQDASSLHLLRQPVFAVEASRC